MSVVVFHRWDLFIPHPWGPAPTLARAGVGWEHKAPRECSSSGGLGHLGASPPHCWDALLSPMSKSASSSVYSASTSSSSFSRASSFLKTSYSSGVE